MKKLAWIFLLLFGNAFTQENRDDEEDEDADVDLTEEEMEARFSISDQNSYSLIADINFSPWASGEDILLVTRGLERVLPKIFNEANWLTRLSQMTTTWLPLNYEAVVIQHEIFGHGYRIRDLGSSRAKVTGYSLGVPPPYGNGGGATHYLVFNKITSTESAAIASAGVEATAILANLTKLLWLKPRLIDPKQISLYLLAQHDINNYIGSMKIVRKNQVEVFDGHDINAYLFWLNLTYPNTHLSSSRLRSLSWIGILDPFTFYGIWGWFYYIATGKSFKIPMIPLKKDVGYLFSFRLGLAPYGPEFFFENYFSAQGSAYYGYLRAGNHANNSYLGFGAILPTLWRINCWDFGLTFDAWYQPKLLLQPGFFSVSQFQEKPSPQNPLYLDSERNQKQIGGSITVLFSYHWTQKIGGELELGGKTKGFLPGNSLWAAPIIRGGFSFYF